MIVLLNDPAQFADIVRELESRAGLLRRRRREMFSAVRPQ